MRDGLLWAQRALLDQLEDPGFQTVDVGLRRDLDSIVVDRFLRDFYRKEISTKGNSAAQGSVARAKGQFVLCKIKLSMNVNFYASIPQRKVLVKRKGISNTKVLTLTASFLKFVTS